MDEIWHAVGDHSSDVDWYVKRGILAAVYTATELYMLTDHSPGKLTPGVGAILYTLRSL